MFYNIGAGVDMDQAVLKLAKEKQNTVAYLPVVWSGIQEKKGFLTSSPGSLMFQNKVESRSVINC